MLCIAEKSWPRSPLSLGVASEGAIAPSISGDGVPMAHRGQNMAGLCAGTIRLPVGNNRTLQTYAAAL